MNRNEVLREAQTILNGQRANDYGDAYDNHKRIAALWNTYLDEEYGLKPEDVAVMLILLKVARLVHKHTSDSFIDIAGYAALAEEMSSTENVIEFTPER